MAASFVRFLSIAILFWHNLAPPSFGEQDLGSEIMSDSKNTFSLLSFLFYVLLKC